MEEFNFIPEATETKKPENTISGFSFTPDTETVTTDFSKVKPQNIFSIDGSNTNAPQKMEVVNKSLFSRISGAVGNSVLQAMPMGGVMAFAMDNEKVDKLVNSDIGKFGNTMSQSVSRGIFETGKGIGQLISWYGDNMIISKDMQENLVLEDKTVDRLNSFGKLWQKAGEKLSGASNYVLNTNALKLDEEIFAGSIVENPSTTRVVAAAMSAAPSLMFMSGVTKLTGSSALAYYLMAGAESSDLYVESKEAGKSQEEANLLFTASMGGTALIDVVMKPIEKIVAPQAKGLKGKIAQKIVGGLTEGAAEGGQEIWQNMVKKYGLDESQNIFEGVIESFIGGGFAGGAMAGGFTPSSEAFNSLTEVEKENFSNLVSREIAKNADEINDVVYQHIDAGLTKLNDFLSEHEGTAEAQAAIQTKKDLDEIYDVVYDSLKDKQESKIASANAKIVQGLALYGSQEMGVSPMQYLQERFSSVEKIAYKEFNTRMRERNMTEVDFLAQEIDRLKKRGTGTAKNKGVRLSQFIKQQGGIKDDRGDVKAMGATPGLLNTKGGLALDQLTQMAWDNGYIQGTERPEINQLLDLLAEDLRGNNVYTEQDSIKEDDAEYYRSLQEAIDRAGGDINVDSVEVIKQKLDAYEKSLSDYSISVDENTNVAEEEFADFINFQLPSTAYKSNGKADINSSEFKTWFGDSEVVNKNGKPLMVYHGTDAVFEEFEARRPGNGFNPGARGIYFSSSRSVAKTYSDNLHSVYLKIENPGVYDAQGQSYNDIMDNLNSYISYAEQIENRDGIIIKNVRDDWNGKGRKADTYVVFEPTQIKSVNNQGTFDKDNANIYYQTNNASGGSFSASQAEVRGFNDYLNKAIKGELNPNAVLRVRNSTPEVFKALGVTDKPLGLPYSVLKKINVDKHGVDLSVVSELPNLISDPIMVFDSLTQDSSLVAVLDAKDASGRNVVAIIKPTDGFSNIIPSMYGRNEFDNFVENNINAGMVRYVDKKRVSQIVRPSSLQLLGVDNSRNHVSTVSNVLQKSDIVNDISYQDRVQDEVYRNPKGAYSKRADGQSIISLFERADASTFMHETAHFFFEELKTFAKTSDKSKQMLETINNWLGSDGNSYSTEQVEQFARGFEQYLREGKAPSNYLKQTFNSFMNWLRQLYKTALDLNVKLNDDVRSVYGEILGGQDLDFYLEAPVSEVLDHNRKMAQQKRAEMDEVYKQNISRKLAKKGLVNKFASSTQDVYAGMRDWLSDALTPLEERIKEISPDLYNMNRRLELAKINKTNAYYKKVKNFVETAQKMPADEFHTFDLALKNRDMQTVQTYIQKYNLEKDFGDIREILNELREGMIEVGVDVEYLPDYFPRKINDSKGLLDYVELEFSGKPEYSIIQKLLEEKNKDGRVRTVEDEAQIINSLIRGYAGGISIANISNVKERTIKYIDEHLDNYYKNSLDALTDYISGAVQVIENKKYFGKETKEVQNLRRMVANRATTIEEYKSMEPKEAKWKEIKTRNYKIGAVDAQIRNTFDKTLKKELEDRKTKLEAEVEYLQNRKAEQVKSIAINRMEAELSKLKKEVDELADSTVENSVGNLIRDLVNDGVITRTQEERLKALLLARFSNKGLGNVALRFLRDGGYIWTLGNIESAITQFGDLGTSAYQNGLWNTAFEYIKAWAGKSAITMDDLGLNDVIKDGSYTDISILSRSLDKVLKYAGFEKMDKIAKQTLVNSAIKKARTDAKNNSPELESYLKAEFGEKWIDVKMDMAEGRITDEIIEYAMFKLMDVQPITIDQMPAFYAEGGKKRMFYMMKSYFIKQLNEYRKICFDTAKSNPQKAIKDMARLTAYLMLFNAGADLLKDILFGRKIDVADTLLDNIFIGGSINRYQAMSIKREGLFTTFQKQLMFPVMMDTFVVDALSDKEVKNWKSWSNIPIIGRPLYWWFGGGHLKNEKEKKRVARNRVRSNRERKKRKD